VVLEGLPVGLAPTAVQPVAMFLHELATNAAKHGALSVPGGRVTLSWRLDAAEDRLCLDWAEAGGPPVRAPAAAGGRRGLGSRVIEATMRGQLGGTLRLDWHPEGLRCAVSLPADRVLAARHPQAAASPGAAAPAPGIAAPGRAA
jgi:two-component sensor histidine kinase